jgi:hypothetical protein
VLGKFDSNEKLLNDFRTLFRLCFLPKAIMWHLFSIYISVDSWSFVVNGGSCVTYKYI